LLSVLEILGKVSAITQIVRLGRMAAGEHNATDLHSDKPLVKGSFHKPGVPIQRVSTICRGTAIERRKFDELILWC
jgi:hypothetical protein